MAEEISSVVKHFAAEGEFIYGEAYGCGHINDTYAVYFKREDRSPVRYILQRINTAIFDAEELMKNIKLVTDFLKKKIENEGGDPERNTLSIIPTKEGALYYRDKEGNCFRMYLFIEDTITYQSAANVTVSKNAGRAFGHFQKQLSDFDAKKLKETIKNFHDTGVRFKALQNAVNKDACGRVKLAKEEIKFAFDREGYCNKVTSLLGTDKIPYRVTHNDTKLNNILMDPKTGEGVCIIDLDTVMPGSLLYDFGDSNRFGSNNATEDETDLSKVTFNLDMFKAYTEGFMEEAKDTLTDTETELLAFSCILMTFEVGIRFLADYLEGDVYFKTTHETHNLERARNQFKLIEDMESKLDEMNEIIKKIRG